MRRRVALKLARRPPSVASPARRRAYSRALRRARRRGARLYWRALVAAAKAVARVDTWDEVGNEVLEAIADYLEHRSASREAQ